MSRLRVIMVNDVYGMDNLPCLATAIREKSSEGVQTIVVLPGDFVSPSLLSGLDYGRGMIECLNAIGVNYVCFGNHESDIPHPELLCRINESKFTWINTNMNNLKVGKNHVPTHEIVDVNGGRKVGILGFMLERKDTKLFGGATIESVQDTARHFHAELESQGVDMVIPLTHQVIEVDREFANAFKRTDGHPNENCFPLLLGGHDHDVFVENVEGCQIIKTGMDAVKVAVCDLSWPDNSSPKVEIKFDLFDTQDFAPDRDVQDLVDKHMRVINDLDRAPLFKCTPSMELSSKGTRYHDLTLVTIFCSAARDGFAVDACVLTGGMIRADTLYEKSKKWFTCKDLKSEIPFDSEVVCLPMKGSVLSAAVAVSREKSYSNPPVEWGSYLHHDDGMVFDHKKRQVTHIGMKRLIPDKIYDVVLPFRCVIGQEFNPPLDQYIIENPDLVSPHDAAEWGRPLKMLLVSYFSRAVWYEVGKFDNLDSHKKGYLTKLDVTNALSAYFGVHVRDIFIDVFWKSIESGKMFFNIIYVFDFIHLYCLLYINELEI